MRILFLLLSFFAFPTAAVATPSKDDVREMLDQSNITQLEKTFAELHAKSLENNDFTTLRGLNADLFATTDPVRRETIRLWAKAYPTSTYAQAARYWMHHHLAWIYRGERVWSDIPHQAARAFQDEIGQAVDAAFLSVKSGFDYAPAADAAASSFKFHRSDLTVSSLLENVFSVIPNEHTLKIAIQVESPGWGGSIEAIAQLCTRFAPMIDGYDPELCMIQAVLNKHAVGREWQKDIKFAFERYQERDGEVPEAFALQYVLDTFDTPSDPAELERLRRYHETKYFNGHNASSFFKLIQFIIPEGRAEAYREVHAEKVVAHRQAALLDDPYNPKLLHGEVERLIQTRNKWIDDGNLDEARQVWGNMTELGGFDPDTWLLGSRLERKRSGDVFGLGHHPYLVNTFLTSNTPGTALLDVLQNLAETHAEASDNAASEMPRHGVRQQITQLRCPMIRAMRLMSYACDNQIAPAEICTPDAAEAYIDYVQTDLEIMGGCPVEASQSVEQLMYKTIALDAFDDWKSRQVN